MSTGIKLMHHVEKKNGISSIPKMFSSKNNYCFNSSCMRQKHSVIPRMELDDCDHDKESNRMFQHRGDACDCDCVSDGFWACIRRNKQWLCKIILITFVSLTVFVLLYFLYCSQFRCEGIAKRIKENNQTLWIPHYHDFSWSELSKKKEGRAKNKTNVEAKIEFPVSVYKFGKYYKQINYYKALKKKKIDQPTKKIKPFFIQPFYSEGNNNDDASLEGDIQKVPFIFPDESNFNGKTKRSVSSSTKKIKKLSKQIFKKKNLKDDILQNLKFHKKWMELEEKMENQRENLKSNSKNVFEPFSLTTPSPSYSYAYDSKSEESSSNADITLNKEENIEENFKNLKMESENEFFHSLFDQSINTLSSDNKFLVNKFINHVKKTLEQSVESKILNRNAYDGDDFRLDFVDGKNYETTMERSKGFSSKSDVDYGSRLRYGHSPLDYPWIEAISLSEAIKKRKETKKQLFLNGKVIGGSSDVKLLTGPDVSKATVDALETLKTGQQLSFTPSGASQFLFPYQMCLFANPLMEAKPSTRNVRPRLLSSRTSLFSHPSPSLTEKENKYFAGPGSQQNFLTFSINNYASPFPNHQLNGPSSGSSPHNILFPLSSFPSHQQQFFNTNFLPPTLLPNVPPMFCTYLQPPMFQFPTVPGTADFNHAKCADCEEKDNFSPFNKNDVFDLSRITMTCSDENVFCRDGSTCIPIENWCDNEVHCPDVSDEMFCSCRERVARERLCDGYIDCPRGEDETGCFGCPKSSFSCNSVITPESCIPLNKRCDGFRDCALGNDENDCSALFFQIYQNQSYQVSYDHGFLHRNWQGDWFPVCVDMKADSWAKEACSTELGYLPEFVDVNFAKVPDYYKGPFIVQNEVGTLSLQDHCKGHLSTYVKCPAVKCGKTLEIHNLQEMENRFRRFTKFLSNRTMKNSFNKRLKKEETRRVVGGRESEPRAWPWAVAVYKDGSFLCGGVILENVWILTAAHCMDEYWKHFYEIRGGMLRRFSFSPMEQVRIVEAILVHENYNPTIMSNDLALLRLKTPFHFNRWVRPVCLPSIRGSVSNFFSSPIPGSRCMAIGWGALRERGADTDHLREVEIPIMTRCNHKEDVIGAEICAGRIEGGKDTCQGDSGGPLLCKNSLGSSAWYVAGIVSHGEGCARPREPGAYTRISLFLDWITTNANDLKLPDIKPMKVCPGFRCGSGSKLCIPRKWICNGFTDCLEAEDEKNCSSEIFYDQYLKQMPAKNFKGTAKLKTNISKEPLLISSNNSNSKHGDSFQLKKLFPANFKVKKTYFEPDDQKNENLKASAFDPRLSENNFQQKISANDSSHPRVNASVTNTNFKTEMNEPENEFSKIAKDGESYESYSLKSLKLLPQNGMDLSGKEESPVDTLFSFYNFSKTGKLQSEVSLSKKKNLFIRSSQSIKMEPQSNGNSENFDVKSKIHVRKPIKPNFFPQSSDVGIENFNATRFVFTENDTYKEATSKKTILSKTHSSMGFNLKKKESEDHLKIKIKNESDWSRDFECREIKQSIPLYYLCDGTKDCEDGSDETGCSCLNLLLNKEPRKICDNRIDCPDGSDERDCKSCANGEFYCKSSKNCLPSFVKCNGVMDCPFGEDESNCFTLSKTLKTKTFVSESLEREADGFVLIYYKGLWKLFCQEEIGDFDDRLVAKVCKDLGWPGYEKYENVTLSPRCTTLRIACSQYFDARLSPYRIANGGYLWPWNAFVYSDGVLVCSAVLLHSQWLLASFACLQNISLSINYLVAKLGSANPDFKCHDGSFVKIDDVRLLPGESASLLHFHEKINITRFVRPTGIPHAFDSDPETDICVAASEKVFFLKISKNCTDQSICYDKLTLEPKGCRSKPWMGVVVCRSRAGWFPSSTFIENKGSCGFNATKLVNLESNWNIVRAEINENFEIQKESLADCDGFRCFQGFCIPKTKVCDGIPDCSLEEDENIHFCDLKSANGNCGSSELKCRNGACISKNLFGDGKDDCGDGSDEPKIFNCLKRLRLKAFHKMCKGKSNCEDKTKESFALCSCDHSKFKCKLSGHCVPEDFVCDGEKDCIAGEDEEDC